VNTTTRQAITKLRDDCTAVGNSPLARLCTRALTGDEAAEARVTEIITNAAHAPQRSAACRREDVAAWLATQPLDGPMGAYRAMADKHGLSATQWLLVTDAYRQARAATS